MKTAEFKIHDFRQVQKTGLRIGFLDFRGKVPMIRYIILKLIILFFERWFLRESIRGPRSMELLLGWR